jgi:ATP-dependent DNA helicase RecG
VINLEILNQWLLAPVETEQLEFKEANQQFDTTKLLRYCVALANEGGGHLVLGVTNKPPRKVVGSQAFSSQSVINSIKALIVQKLRFRVETTELIHPDGRVLVFEVPPRPMGQPIAFDGAYLMRAGEDLVPMTPDLLKRIFAEDQQDWFSQAARADASPDDVIALLGTGSA